MIEISYELSEKPDKKLIKTCDDGMNGFREAMIIVAKTVGGRWLGFVMWFLTRFYKKKISDTKIAYQFYLIPTNKALSK